MKRNFKDKNCYSYIFVMFAVLIFTISWRCDFASAQDWESYDSFSGETINSELWYTQGEPYVTGDTLFMTTDNCWMHALQTKRGMKVVFNTTTAAVGIGSNAGFYFATNAPSGGIYMMGLFEYVYQNNPEDPIQHDVKIFTSIFEGSFTILSDAQLGVTYEFGLEYTDGGHLLASLDGTVLHTYDLVNGNQGFLEGAPFNFNSGIVENYGGSITSQVFTVYAKTADKDTDGVSNDEGNHFCSTGEVINCDDNCVNIPNGPNNGTCIVGTIGESCISNGDCGTSGACSMNQEDMDGDGSGDACDNCMDVYNQDQEDIYPPQGNGIGDACDCEGNFNCDDDCDGSDAFDFKVDFGRSSLGNPCETGDPCDGDFDCDNDCDGSDAFIIKEDFGRSSFLNPCPTCTQGDWCTYP